MNRARLEEITALHHVYGDKSGAPEVQVDVSTFDDAVAEGDDVIVYDSYGTEVQCTVKRLVAVVVPDWDSMEHPQAAGRQEGLL